MSYEIYLSVSVSRVVKVSGVSGVGEAADNAPVKRRLDAKKTTGCRKERCQKHIATSAAQVVSEAVESRHGCRAHFILRPMSDLRFY